MKESVAQPLEGVLFGDWVLFLPKQRYVAELPYFSFKLTIGYSAHCGALVRYL